MLDPVVHAALVVIFTWLVQLAFAAIGLDLGNEAVEGLATVIVGYILSLFGLELWFRGTTKPGAVGERRYKPPFVG
jgi:hypothetical protein